jgi:hypothetical protein
LQDAGHVLDNLAALASDDDVLVGLEVEEAKIANVGCVRHENIIRLIAVSSGLGSRESCLLFLGLGARLARLLKF